MLVGRNYVNKHDISNCFKQKQTNKTDIHISTNLLSLPLSSKTIQNKIRTHIRIVLGLFLIVVFMTQNTACYITTDCTCTLFQSLVLWPVIQIYSKSQSIFNYENVQFISIFKNLCNHVTLNVNTPSPPFYNF